MVQPRVPWFWACVGGAQTEALAKGPKHPDMRFTAAYDGASILRSVVLQKGYLALGREGPCRTLQPKAGESS